MGVSGSRRASVIVRAISMTTLSRGAIAAKWVTRKCKESGYTWARIKVEEAEVHRVSESEEESVCVKVRHTKTQVRC